jgi:hypothetical protein
MRGEGEKKRREAKPLLDSLRIIRRLMLPRAFTAELLRERLSELTATLEVGVLATENRGV